MEPSGPPQIASTPPRQPHTALSARQRLYIDCEMGARAVISVTSPPRHSRAILQAIRPTSCNLAQGGITAASNHSIIRSISAQSHCLQAVSALDSSKSQTVFGRGPNRSIFVQTGSPRNQEKNEIILLRIFCNLENKLFPSRRLFASKSSFPFCAQALDEN